MRQYLEPIQTAALFFPLIAFVFTLPFMLYQYHKYGSILVLRIVMTYSFILYLMCAYFLTILPLPSMEKVAALTSPRYQLIPFREAAELFENPKVVWGDFSTYKYFVLNRTFFQIVANVVMTVPFGVYLRYYFGADFSKTLRLTFLLSLLFEVTQLTGLFFLYPRAYRMADVDDLITNTLGGAIGYWIAPLLMRFLPTRERMNTVAYQRSKHVSIFRRLCAAMLDGSLLLVIIAVGFVLLPPTLPSGVGLLSKVLTLLAYYSCYVLLYFGVGEWLMRGRTPGKMFLHIKLVDSRTMGRPKLWQCVVRYGIFYLVVLPAPMMALFFLIADQSGDASLSLPTLIVCVLFMLIFVCFCVGAVIVSFQRGKRLPHGWLSRTQDVSTLRRAKKTARRPSPELPPPMSRGIAP